MTITRIKQAGAESGLPIELDAYTCTVSGTYKYSGNYGYDINFYGLSGAKYGRINIPNTRRVRVGLWWRPYGVNASNQALLCGFNVGYGGWGGIYLDMQGASAGSPLHLYTTGDVLRDTKTSAFSGGTWIHIGWDVKVDSTNGWAYVYLNGVLSLSYTGNTGDWDITYFQIGTGGQPPYQDHEYFDDIYVDDVTGEADIPKTPSILYFRPIFPNAVGDYSQWTPSSGSGFQCVDEVPASTADYVQSENLGDKDSYNMATQTLDTDELCKAIIPVIYAKRGGVTEKIKIGTRLSSVNQFSDEKVLTSGTYALLSERFELDPSGGNWEQADIDALQLIIESAGTYT
jgi:hypothetical protein